MIEPVRIYFDGGSRGNPGPAAGAAYTEANGGRSAASFLPHATNNEAEYHGLLAAIRLAKAEGFESVLFLGDSKLVVSQVTGEWKAKNESMSELLAKVHAEIRGLARWRISWIAREENAQADRIANETMDTHLGIVPLPVDETALLREGVRLDIQALNRLGVKAGFNDLRRLKVGGMDEYSRLNREALAEKIAGADVLSNAFHSRVEADPNTKSIDDVAKTKLVINALRWTARGLLSELAIRKVLIDFETAKTMRGKK